ncbi:YrdB family protein [Luteimicrobium sp. DT211]|uniref:YrdB family protein n=1 Tax=Luteimicrobium sp. DT211 TaxID=3393412 RepID=UPI003CEA9752
MPQRPTSPAEPGAELRLSPAGLVAFAVEIAMLVLLAVAGWRLGGNAALSVLVAVVLVAVAVVAWGWWLAPRSPRRLARTPRIAAKAALFAVTAVLAVAVGLVVPGLVFAVVAAASLAWSRD